MKHYIWFLSAVILCSSCKKFLDVNTNPNSPEDVQAPLILAPVETAISDFVFAGNAPIITQNYVQAIAANQLNPGIGNYQLFNVDLDGDWFNFYVTCLTNLRILSEKGEKDSSYNYAGIAKILSAYTLGTATDLWGDIPYSAGFTGIDNLTPAYDKQEDIYKVVQSLLSAGIGDIARGSTVVPGTDDFFYEGDMEKWTKLAYVLKARYFMHLSKKLPAAVVADSVLDALSKGMISNDDNFTFKYAGTSGAENPWNLTFGEVSTYVLNATFVEGFKNRNDPRLTKMVSPASNTGLYTGRVIGTPTGSLHSYSYPTAFYAGAAASTYLVNYAEALFLKAEATLMQSGAVAAQQAYVAGITAHMQLLSVPQADISTYITSRPLTPANALQLIMEEKSVADFLSPENFVDWRRTGFPVLTKVNGALSEIPRRLLYPQSEILTNAQTAQTAKLTDRVWWNVQ